MAETQPSTPEPGAKPPAPDAARPQQRGPPLHQIYALPAPIRTFPLPVFYPNNPISIFHVAYAWLSQLWSPPLAEPSVVHEGVWSAKTSSIHILDENSTRAFWEQGFYGKGNLSRSEPNWLKREKVRRGLQEAHVSEILTVERREERHRAKLERARLEQEAIQKTRLEEAREALAAKVKAAKPKTPTPTRASTLRSIPDAPVSPEKLLALPNSTADVQSVTTPSKDVTTNGVSELGARSVKDNPAQARPPLPRLSTSMNNAIPHAAPANGTVHAESAISSPGSSGWPKPLKRQKSVRFSPMVESTPTFKWLDPSTPHRFSPANGESLATLNEEDPQSSQRSPRPRSPLQKSPLQKSPLQNSPLVETEPDLLLNKEHLQLMPEEAFFLNFGLGVLTVTDPTYETPKPLSTMELFTLFRQHSYFPPRSEPGDPALQPDDNFLVHYSVYHHFRSLGWVPRGGIKFGVDWLLYTRGPVFDHAEFGLIVIPSYSDPLWKEMGKKTRQKSWQWLHATVRVLSHVTKSLVLVYVDIPPPSKFDEALEKGFADVFELYKVREVMVKRWSSNRNR
ncbi:hypothetical protein EDB81DRAFT_264124 [Dactylonectria macrodidyma]|uniref:tRNA-intron lyase n=1 Tax=Dactylonectria macrodidyma TaxID=307937 RepID=A0A9P9JJS6_9HYPO|nr:hypothetical protein EDB81DRAFT_264124 [Dactylonectria macrodidyma]